MQLELEDLGKLLSDVEQLFHSLTKVGAQVGGDSADHLRQGIGQGIGELRGRLTDLQQRLQRTLKHSTRDAEKAVREHPFESVAIAAVVGFVAGAVLARRN